MDILYSMKEYVRVLHIIDIILVQEPACKSALELRLEALESLWDSTHNYVEQIWLDYAIKTCR